MRITASCRRRAGCGDQAMKVSSLSCNWLNSLAILADMAIDNPFPPIPRPQGKKV